MNPIPKGSRRHAAARIVLVLIAGSIVVSSCKHAKQAQKSDAANKPLIDTTADTNRSEISKQIDSLKDKVSGFLHSLLPPSADTTKGYPVVTPPPSTAANPSVGTAPPEPNGFLKTPVKREIQFDSSGITARDVFLNGDVSDPMHMSLGQYLQSQEDDAITRGFRDQLRKSRDTGTTVEPTTGILGDYNQISIPIPPSIVPTIFGRPSINLRVNGDVAIHLAYRDNQTYATTGAAFFGSETGLDFKQEINVSTNGTIGDKLKIGADWGSDRMFQFDNLLKLSYQGFPDEILQSFEAGNVNFTTPSQYIGVQQALFGFKAVTRFGPLYFTALAAQKKGERQAKSFGGGAGGPAMEHLIKPWEYRRNRFVLDTSFLRYYEPYYSTVDHPNVDAVVNMGGEYVYDRGTVEVWVSDQSKTNIKRRRAVAWYSLPYITIGSAYGTSYRDTTKPVNSPDVASDYFVKLDTTRYTVEPYTGVITLSQEPDDNGQIVAVSYQTKTKTGVVQYGEPEIAAGAGVLVLKMIKPIQTFQHREYAAWKNLLKNSYYLGGAGFDDKDFALRIFDQLPNGHQAEYVRGGRKPIRAISVTGLDRYNNTNPTDQTPDGLVDYGGTLNNSFVIDKRTGTLTFPFLEPFGADMDDFFKTQLRLNPKYVNDSTFYLPEIYNTTQDILRLRETKQVQIGAKYSGGISSTLNLNAFNLVEGSVKVTVGASPLVEGTDFRVDYNSGTVTLLRPDLVTAGNINVEYDVHDIFTNATKNVLGFRAEVPILDHGALGMTLMNYSMHLPTLKTRQGEEPLSNWVWGIDGSYKVDAPIITDALNLLPIFNLKDKSEFVVRADAALSLPNPNTQKSPLPVDNNASIAYLDDFEGGKNEFPLYMSYGRWSPASQPIDTDYQQQYPNDSVYAREVNTLKGKSYWGEPVGVSIHDIKPNQSTARPNDPAQVLQVTFDPRRPGIYNPYPKNAPFDQFWGGMMQYNPGLNVAATNTDAIEFWMKIDNLDPNDLANAKLRFDMGRISEDVIPDKIRQTEDQNLNGRYDPGEDLGLDTLNDDQERLKYPGANNPNDPNNDDYSYTQGSNDFSGINGQEGNEQDAKSGYTPDTEDLDGNGAVNLDNGYYEYEIPLDLSKYVVGNTNKTWYQFRIPLSDYKRIVGTNDSSFSNISYYRVWVKGVNKSVEVQLHEIMLTGSQWTRGAVGISQTNPVSDVSLRVTYVNIQDNTGAPTFYFSPPGTQRDILPGNTTFVYGNEQSLDMQLKDVLSGPTVGQREAQRLFPTPNDIFNYRGMSVFVHGDPTPGVLTTGFKSSTDTLNRVWVYFRFGTDPFNYYEYRRPLDTGWQNIHVDFQTLTTLKAGRLADQVSATTPANDGVPGSTYKVVGSPTLTNAPQFTLGVENETGHPLTTDVWWDEMRLLDANDKADFAYNTSGQLKLAEFGRISGGMANQRPDFHRVDERFNMDRSTTINWNVIGEFNMEKILPKWMEDKQTKLPITIAHNESVVRPKYIANTDIDLDNTIAALTDQHIKDSLLLTNETLQIKNSFGASDIALRFPGSFFLIPAFINRLNFGFGYTESFLRSPQYEYDRAWNWTASARYTLPALPNISIPLLSWVGANTFFVGPYSGFKFTPMPTNISFLASTTRGRTHSFNRVSTLSLPPEGSSEEDLLAILRSNVPLINRTFTATRDMAFSWKPFEGGFLSPSFEYSLDVISNLVPLETDKQFNHAGVDANGNPIYNYDSVYYFQRNFSDIARDIFFKNGSLIRPGDDYNAQQKVHMGTRPRLPGLFGLEKLIAPRFDYRVEYRWQDAQTQLQNAKQAAWNNTITTGIELNVRTLGTMIFGEAAAENPGNGRVRGERDRDVGVTPEELPSRPFDDRESPVPNPKNQTRNQVERGEQMRPQALPNPLGNNPSLLDTMRVGRNQPSARVDTAGKVHIRGVGTAGERDQEYAIDTLITPMAPPQAEPVQIAEAPSITVKELLQEVLQKPLFDWNGTVFNFTQTNQSINGALMGSGSGITNMLARGIFAPEDDQNGPSRAYQLGLITDPSGRLLIRFKPQFPFVRFDVLHGLRAPNPFGRTTDITDGFTQMNNFELSTSRPLWTGASISLNWKLSFDYNERNTLRILPDGSINPLYTSTNGDVSRTFLSIPSIPFVSGLQSGIERVGQKWIDGVNGLGYKTPFGTKVDQTNAKDSLPGKLLNEVEQKAFMQGFETLPLFTSFLREYLPRLNYSFSWTGLEKFPLFTFADHISVRHAYNGTYKRSFGQNPSDSLNLTTLQTIVYGFRPLVALDASWDKLWGGRMTTSFNYDTQTEWAADYASTRITKRLSTTVGLTANYQRQGVSIPFLKLNLKNEFGASFTFSETIASDRYFNFWNILDNPAGISNGGLTKTTFEPRISYTVSQQLTIEGFYRYERTTPEAAGQISPPTRLIQAGVDVRLKIQ